MPIHDVACGVCGVVLHDQYMPLYTLPEPRRVDGYVVRQDFRRPIHCGEAMTIIPPRVTMDALEPMQEFAVTVEDGQGGHRVEVIDSLAKLRRVERESEQRYKNGEGRPMVWRDYSQDRSNRDAHTLGSMDAPVITDEMKRKFRPTPVEANVAESTALGPGVTEHTPSPLDGL